MSTSAPNLNLLCATAMTARPSIVKRSFRTLALSACLCSMILWAIGASYHVYVLRTGRSGFQIKMEYGEIEFHNHILVDPEDPAWFLGCYKSGGISILPSIYGRPLRNFDGRIARLWPTPRFTLTLPLWFITAITLPPLWLACRRPNKRRLVIHSAFSVQPIP